MNNPIAENVLGTLGAIFINHKRHNTEGLQPSMMLLWAAAGVPLGVYNIVEEFNIALRIQPQILTILSLITWAQCLYYGKKFPITKCITFVLSLLSIFGGFETGLILGLKEAKTHDIRWPIMLMAVLSASLLAAGVLRHYWDIYVHRTVRGISFFFVGIDAAGDLFSIISVLFGPKIDVLGVVIYGTELGLWMGIFACGGVFNLVPWVRARSKSEVGNEVELEMEPELVSLDRMPSSNSVFRTASGSEVVARRAWLSS
ncbi:uncharacterized protein N7477_005044 [Penicillium maclennaniae]|uniref:uncharacterized protein n=1 Tax=Penicillium maclennaniae TaxID=1343394 RepID=UPI002540BB7A|nr:uncharacterized protein N7477_005044 [Penicillium maclennaniae]KAJ5675110.1 hypothetical protein N7477_005044 [Penicillium maclennaniae]